MHRQRLVVALVATLSLLVVLGVLGLGLGQQGQAVEQAEPTSLLEYPDVPPTATIAPQPTNAPAVAGTVLFADDFATEASLQNWTVVDLENVPADYRSLWAVEDGKLLQDRTAHVGNPALQETLAVTGPASWTDYTITASVYDQENVTFGLVARRNGNSFYRYRIIPDSFDTVPKQVLEKVVEGVATPLVEIDAPGYEERRWYTVSLSVVGTTIQVTLDGKQVATATDATLTSGQAGVYTRAIGGIFFDDVSVTTP